MNIEDFDVLISEESHTPPEIVGEFVASLRRAGLQLRHERRESGGYAGVEEYLPTLIVLLLTRKLFEGFLNEAGKDLYTLMKSRITRLATRTSGSTTEVRAKHVVSTQTPAKVSGSPAVLSIVATLNDGTRVKFTFSQDMKDGAQSTAVESLLDLLQIHYSSEESRPPGLSIEAGAIARWGMLPLAYDEDRGIWLPAQAVFRRHDL